jgi:hypothetical protein
MASSDLGCAQNPVVKSVYQNGDINSTIIAAKHIEALTAELGYDAEGDNSDGDA